MGVCKCLLYIRLLLFIIIIRVFVHMFMVCGKSEWSKSPLRKRSERRLNFAKLVSLCLIIWHEQREQREQRFKINDLHYERDAHEVRTT